MFQVERKNKCVMIYVSTAQILLSQTNMWKPVYFSWQNWPTVINLVIHFASFFAIWMFNPYCRTCASRHHMFQEWYAENNTSHSATISHWLKRWEIQAVPWNQERIHFHGLSRMLQQVWTTGWCPTVYHSPACIFCKSLQEVIHFLNDRERKSRDTGNKLDIGHWFVHEKRGWND